MFKDYLPFLLGGEVIIATTGEASTYYMQIQGQVLAQQESDPFEASGSGVSDFLACHTLCARV
jgi:hypothetical protein